MTRVTQLIHDAGKYLLISVYPLPTHPTHNFTHKNSGNLETLPGWPKKLDHNRPARCAGQSPKRSSQGLLYPNILFKYMLFTRTSEFGGFIPLNQTFNWVAVTWMKWWGSQEYVYNGPAPSGPRTSAGTGGQVYVGHTHSRSGFKLIKYFWNSLMNCIRRYIVNWFYVTETILSVVSQRTCMSLFSVGGWLTIYSIHYPHSLVVLFFFCFFVCLFVCFLWLCS